MRENKTIINGKFNRDEYYALRNRAKYNALEQKHILETVVWEDVTISYLSYECDDQSLTFTVKYKGIELSDPSHSDVHGVTGCEYILESIGLLWYM
jgi:hypothetical protein